MPTPTTTTRTTGTKNTLWQVDCAPECRFMVREHNQKSLVAAVQNHIKWVHPGPTVPTEKDVVGMSRKV